jgi:hypothetical protein
MAGTRVKNEFESTRNETAVAWLSYYPDIFWRD